MLNPNVNKNPITLEIIEGNQTMTAHCQYVWENFIRRSPARNVFILAHSCGGVCTLDLLKNNSAEFKRRIKAIAFTDSVHKTTGGLSLENSRFLRQKACNWKKSSKKSNTLLTQAEKAPDGCLNLSAGDDRHEYTS